MAKPSSTKQQPTKPPKNVVVTSTEGTKPASGPFLQEDFIDSLYKPHTITGLVAVIATIIYFAFFSTGGGNSETNIKMGLIACVGVFLTYCFLQLRDGYILRPHPAIWRVVLGVNILYLSCMVFILFQNVDDVRSWLRYLYPDLGVPLPERSYASDCRIVTPEMDHKYANIRDTVFDEFILAHVLGYIGKAILVRDVWLAWILSLFFEVVEISLQHWMENFKECWWDHLIIDVALCNNLGIILGLAFCYYFQTKKYNWVAIPHIKETSGKITRFVMQFTPFEWTSYKWESLASFKRFMYVIGMIIAVTIVDLNSFYLKYILWVPPRNPLNTYRLIFWFFVAIPSIREFYQYTSDPNCKRLGANAWVSVAVFTTESLISLKFGSGLFTAPTPLYISLFWVLFAIFFGLWVVLFFSIPKKYHSFPVKLFLNTLVFLWVMCFVLMFLIGCPHLELGKDTFYKTVTTYTPFVCDYLNCAPL